MKPSLLLSSMAILAFASCSTMGGPTAIPAPPGEAGPSAQSPEELPFPLYTYAKAVEGSALLSPVDGYLRYEERDELGLSRAIIETSQEYYLDGKKLKMSYELAIGGLSSVDAEEGPIQAGDRVGTMSATPYISSRSAELDPFMLRQADSAPASYKGLWWFAPAWLLPNSMQWLSFRQVPSLEAAIEDFYRRWADEEVENPEELSVTIHHFPDLDRIRVRFTLDSYPVAAQATQALLLTERNFYGRPGIFTLQNFLDLDAEFDAMIYWQKGFDGFLKDEYELGSPLWLYCSIFTLDHENGLIVVCVRDFSLVSDEEVIATRTEGLR